ncbi:MAG: TonB-dependent receptor [Acidobacteria bacterium]|nr:TonB-dependent receptor [Acidobacteriota bacterium]
MRQKSLFARPARVCLILILLSLAAFSQTSIDSSPVTEGALRVAGPNGTSRGLCPLKKTEVSAAISGFISRVTVTQTFENPFDEKIEAVYTFPLPNDAAVDDLTIRLGDRVIRGKIMERQKAQETYTAAKEQGKTAALLEQQRPNIFTQSVANIAPGAEIRVVISYVETLKYADDTYEFRFPMTIGERYIPSSVDAEDAAKISPQSKVRPGHTVSLAVNLEAGVPVAELASNTHLIEAAQFSASRFDVRLKDADEIPNRDFVLKYRTAGGKMEDAILAHKDARGGFFTLVLQPPDKVLPADTMPKEIVFVLDTSGSMDGFPIKKAKEAMRLTLENVNPQDTFNVITFAGDTRILFEKPVPATRENLAKAKKWLSDTDSGGGTEMMKAIQAALAPSDAQDHVRIVCFMTDGQVGNDPEIIAEVQKHPNARVFAFGIGESVNHFLLDEISREGRGEVEYVGLKDDGSAAARRFYERVRNPLLTDISLEFEGVAAEEVYPRLIPDVFDAKPVTVVGRYARGGKARVILHGKMQGQPFERAIDVDFPDNEASNDVLATLWARRKIAELTRLDYTGVQKRMAAEELQTTMTNLGLEFRLLTPFTSFVAVDQESAGDGTPPKRVEVPVGAPPSTEDAKFIENYWRRREPEPTQSGGGSGNGSGSVATNPQNGLTGGVQETVTVVAASSTIDTTETRSQTNTSTSLLQSLPVNGRSFTSLFSTAGGVTQTADRRAQVEQGLISSNGQRPTSNFFSVDGTGANSSASPTETSFSGNLGAIPNLTASGGTNGLTTLGATQEAAVKTMAPVREQRTAGATVDFVTKGGTNAFHGAAFEYFGDRGLNANDFFANSRRLSRPASRVNQFGGSLGGFLRKDKAFFFADYEGLRLRQGVFALTEVPDLAARQTAAPEIRPLLNAFPLANGAATSSNLAEFAAAFANPAAHDIFGVRIDFQPTDRLRLGARYNFAGSDATVRGDRDFSLNTRRRFDFRTDSLTFSTTATLSATKLVEARVNFTRRDLGQRFAADDFGGAAVSPALFGSAFDFRKYDLTGRGAALAAGRRTASTIDQFEAAGLFTWIKNNHDFSLGANFRRLAANIDAARTERSLLFAGANPAGSAARIDELTRTALPPAAIGNLSVYGQDKWRIAPRLTLDAGLRWDADFAPAAAAPTTVFQNAAPRIPDQLKNFAPRAGFSWGLSGSGRAVIRGGAGLFYDFGNSPAAELVADSAPFYAGGYAFNAAFNGPATVPLRPLIVFDRNLRTPRTWHLFAEYQQEFFRNHIFTATYTASFARKLYLTRTFPNADPNFNLVRMTNNDGRADFQSLQLRFERRFSQGFSFNARYALSKSTDNFSPDTIRENNFLAADLSRERGPSDYDARHQLSVYAIYDVPALFDDGWKRRLTEDWTLAAFAGARSAFPFSAGYDRVNAFGREFFRADSVGGAPVERTVDGLRAFDPAAFAVPAALRQGTLGRNSLRGFGLFQLDASLSRRIRLTSEMQFELGIKAYNLLNNTNFAEPDNSLGTVFPDGSFRPNPYFGRPTTTFGSGGFTPFYLYGGARTLQLSVKFVF